MTLAFDLYPIEHHKMKLFHSINLSVALQIWLKIGMKQFLVIILKTVTCLTLSLISLAFFFNFAPNDVCLAALRPTVRKSVCACAVTSVGPCDLDT